MMIDVTYQHLFSTLAISLAFASCAAEEGYQPISDDERADILCVTTDIHWTNSGTQTLSLGDSHQSEFTASVTKTSAAITTEELTFVASNDALLELHIESDETFDFFSHIQFTLDVRGVSEDDKDTLPWTPVNSPSSLGTHNWYGDLELNLTDGVMVYSVVSAGLSDCSLYEEEDVRRQIGTKLAALREEFETLEFRVRAHVKSGLGDLNGTYYYDFTVKQLN